jgi:adenosylmethionine-8-amino-7-oxononanoate aminotransferase
VATACTPDIIATAKGLGAGYAAIGAVLVREHVYEAFAQGSRRFTLGHTWDGAPLACAVGLAVLEAVRSEGLIQRVHDRGEQLRGELAHALSDIALVREVRGHGYLLGVSFVDPRDGESLLPPDLRVGGRIDAAAFDRGLIVLSTQPTRDGYAGDQTLFAPAFTATDEELGEMVSRFADVVTEVAKGLTPDLERAEPVSPTPAGGVR